MTATNVSTYLSDAASAFLIVGAFCWALIAADRRERHARARARWKAGPAPSNVRRLPR